MCVLINVLLFIVDDTFEKMTVSEIRYLFDRRNRRKDIFIWPKLLSEVLLKRITNKIFNKFLIFNKYYSYYVYKKLFIRNVIIFSSSFLSPEVEFFCLFMSFRNRSNSTIFVLFPCRNFFCFFILVSPLSFVQNTFESPFIFIFRRTKKKPNFFKFSR